MTYKPQTHDCEYS